MTKRPILVAHARIMGGFVLEAEAKGLHPLMQPDAPEAFEPNAVEQRCRSEADWNASLRGDTIVRQAGRSLKHIVAVLHQHRSYVDV